MITVCDADVNCGRCVLGVPSGRTCGVNGLLIGVAGIRRWFGTGFKSREQVEKEEQQRLDEINEERRVKGKKPLEMPKGGGEMGKA
jgi:hypothetical protein